MTTLREIKPHLANAICSIPTLNVPPDAREEGEYIKFFLNTSTGLISVRSWGRLRWKCSGSESALISARLIRANWCPGQPGNNKVRQTVVFDDAGARLEFCKGRKIKQPHISISRKSTSILEVSIPATAEQQKLLSAVCNRSHEQWQREQNQRVLTSTVDREHERKKGRTIDEAKADWLETVQWAERLILGNIVEGGVALDQATIAQIRAHLDGLHSCVNAGQMLQPETRGYTRDGNVIRLDGRLHMRPKAVLS